MCGLIGIFSVTAPSKISEEVLIRMMSCLRHRGPDESGIYMDTRIGLGHTRLSIIGLNNGTQPISNEDGTVWIVLNGEIFNYIELKRELTDQGHRFSTDTDTEVLLHLYEEYGEDCLKLINGQFAFAVWNSSKQELFLARDRVGIRPLYYFKTHDQFIFASEIKAIFQHPAAQPAIDPKALHQIFTIWTTISPDTVFKDVFEIPPGHYLRIGKSGLIQKKYWSLPSTRKKRPGPVLLKQRRKS